jgi:formylglycine-generating enzyme required for sulfatase activity
MANRHQPHADGAGGNLGGHGVGNAGAAILPDHCALIFRASVSPSAFEIMKTPSSKLLRYLTVLSLSIWALGLSSASAQTPPLLNLQLYAGLSITGAVGTVYSVEYVTDLAQTNTWRCLEFLQLPASPYLWADKSAPATGRRFYRAVQTGAPTNMVFIPPGTFRMGSPTNELDRDAWEGPQTAVTIGRGFWMGKYEVTQGEYLAVMGSNPSYFTPANGYGADLNRPVETVRWSDATNYCATLTQRELAAGRIATNSAYRLPTEAEWEYACRAWISDRRFIYGDDLGYTNLTNYAWYYDNYGDATHPVGQKLPNPWGLYDMHGNVYEWCQDWYGTYPSEIAVDPQGPASGSYRVIRGGNWGSLARYCRSASRDGYPEGRSFSLGFRVVLAPGRP